jgi:hypothetical protein
METWRHPIEKIDCWGKIQLQDGKIVKVRYFYVVAWKMDARQLSGQIEVRGAVEVSTDDGMVDLSGEHFTLKTKDGRCIEAQTTAGSLANRQWEFIATGPQLLAPC